MVSIRHFFLNKMDDTCFQVILKIFWIHYPFKNSLTRETPPNKWTLILCLCLPIFPFAVRAISVEQSTLFHILYFEFQSSTVHSSIAKTSFSWFLWIFKRQVNAKRLILLMKSTAWQYRVLDFFQPIAFIYRLIVLLEANNCKFSLIVWVVKKGFFNKALFIARIASFEIVFFFKLGLGKSRSDP